MKLLFLSGLRWSISAILLLNCCCLIAQVSVAGVVVDPDGASVPNVEVLLKTLRGDAVSDGSVVADPAGRFHFPHVASGDYELQIPSKYGFERYQAPIHVVAGMRELRIQLNTPVVTQDVTVGPETNQISPDTSANRDQVSADARMLERVPVFDQNYIAALTPFLDQTGVATSGVTVIVDGIEMKGTGVSASAIAEAHINNDPYSAETNRPGKGRIEIITKPGSPQLHGTLNFTFRDSTFDAKNYFATIKPFEQKRIYEGSITGPIPIDHKTTFLLSGT